MTAVGAGQYTLPPASKIMDKAVKLILFLILPIFLVVSLIIFHSPVHAQSSTVPTVDLKITYAGVTTDDDYVDIKTGDTRPISLSWTTTGNPTVCTARTLWSGGADPNWSGSKGSSGTFDVTGLSFGKAYVYTLDCSNEAGDAAGDSVTINMGVNPSSVTTVPPIGISLLKVTVNGVEHNWDDSNITAATGSNVTVKWDTVNSTTDYSVCISSGSWPALRPGSGEVNLPISTSEVYQTYQFNISCSNEANADETAVVIRSVPAGTPSSSASPSSDPSTGPSQTPSAPPVTGVPSVDLKINYAGVTTDDDYVNINTGDTHPIELTWTTTGNPTSCTARTLWSGGADPNWSGTKGQSGTFNVTGLSFGKAYVYTLDCSNEFGDAAGDSVTINMGVDPISVTTQPPIGISLLKVVTPDGVEHNWDDPNITASVGSNVTVKWETVNSETDYSVCVSSGSWPAQRTGSGNVSLPISSNKIHQFNIFCSNEANADETAVVIKATSTASSFTLSKIEISESQEFPADKTTVLNPPFNFDATGQIDTTFTFATGDPGIKNIWVKYIPEQGEPVIVPASIELLGGDPDISTVSCSVSGSSVTFRIEGTNFGSNLYTANGVTYKGKVTSNDQTLAIQEDSWENNRTADDPLIATLSGVSSPDQNFPVTVTRFDGKSDSTQCNPISKAQLSIGADYFCPAIPNHTENNVTLSVYEAEQTTKVAPSPKGVYTVSINSSGLIDWLNNPFQFIEGKKYIISLDAPKILKRFSDVFTATTQTGSTKISDVMLYMGDISGVNRSGDGQINSLDYSQMTSEWGPATSATKSADFNIDTVVNSFDWACMIFGFNKSDEAFPTDKLIIQ